MMYPEALISDELKLSRGNSALTTDEIAAQIMVKLAREGWKHFPAALPEEILGKVGMSKRQYALLYTAVVDGRA